MITPSFSLTATERVLPKLALDFTTASLDPRVTFTRTGATATVVNSSGLIAGVAANTPRFDYTLNTGGVCKGLLIEESRTNLCTFSQDLSGTNWGSPNGATVQINQATAPDGTTTANYVTQTGGTQIFRKTITLNNAIIYAASCYVKAVSGNTTFRIDIGDTTEATITLTSSWQRITVTNLGANNWVDFKINGPGTYAIWGAQIEVGAFATSYIPTTSAALTRNVDVATMTGTNFSDWYSAGAGGIVALVLPSTVSGTRPVLQFDDATANEVIALSGNTTNPELVIVDGGSPQAQIDAGTIAANTAYNLGAAWNTNNCAAAVNGGAAVTDTSATIPTVTQARLGSDGTNYLNGHFQTVRYWPQRLIDAEVQAFSK